MNDTEIKQKKVHISVMIDEVLDALNLSNKRNVVDATLGLGGHTEAILSSTPKSLRIIGFDADLDHINESKKRLKKYSDRVVFINNNFENLLAELKENKVRVVDAILFDLGLASPHVDDAKRGFSFLKDGDLDMRFDQKSDLTASYVVNKYSQKDLIRIFREFGEEKNARKLAIAITNYRKKKEFKTTQELADFIEKNVGRSGRIHPATRIFQAIRIEVNRELEVLATAIEQAVNVLKPGGRIVVISYHSLEDRIVKNMFKDFAGGYFHGEERPGILKLITKKPICPTNSEVINNPRSRSAKMRVAEKL